ncbi:MAG: hypothetical protein CSA34_03990 [Desulfobulbus propionicus]|nr:MAG: hypothetical protein CSA34_03990 [Desulfobulbus propionicus]
MEHSVALNFEGGVVFRNVRPTSMLVEELEQKKIEYVQVDPKELKYGSWGLVLVFKDKETKDKYTEGQLQYAPGWLPGQRKETQRINPLKAAKRSVRRK